MMETLSGDSFWGSSWGDGTRVRRGANGSARGGGWGEGGELSREGTERKEEGGGVQCPVLYCPVIALVITPLFPFHSAPPPPLPLYASLCARLVVAGEGWGQGQGACVCVWGGVDPLTG